MKNVFFPDEEVSENDLYFVCFIIERVARKIHQRNAYVVNTFGVTELRKLLSVASVLHCENPDKVAADWIRDYSLQYGNFDIANVNRSLVVSIPSETQMGKVYKRLILNTLQKGEDYAQAIVRVYNSSVCETIDNYNSSAYYEPSYVITRAYYNGF